MARLKELTTVYLDPGVLDALRDLSARTGVPMAAYIRAALREWLERNWAGRGLDDEMEAIPCPS
jgi:predicted DNA-binding protein